MSLMLNPQHGYHLDYSNTNNNGMIPHHGYHPMHPQMSVVPQHMQHLPTMVRGVPEYCSPQQQQPSPNINTATSTTSQQSSGTNSPSPSSSSNNSNNTSNNSPISQSSPVPNNISVNSSVIGSPNQSIGMSSNSKRIIITQQTCLVEEKFSKNGVQKNVHVVVKNNPFLLTLSLLDNSFNFHNLSPEVQLVYDSESLKEVDSANVKPLDYKTRSNEEGDQLTIELRIKVLSSQLEDMLFRARVKIVDPRTRKEIPTLSVITHPIRVVSKPDQVKKKAKKRKRAPTDSLMDTLNRIEHQQKEQQRLLKKLCNHDKENYMVSNLAVPGSAVDSPAYRSSIDQSQNQQNQQQPPQLTTLEDEDGESTSSKSPATGNLGTGVVDKDDFQKAFKDFIFAFKQLQCMDPDGADQFKINTCANDAQTMSEILELVKVELTKKEGENGGECNSTSPCSCKTCPYKHKVDNINQSYESYLNTYQQQQSLNGVVPQITTQQQQPHDQNTNNNSNNNSPQHGNLQHPQQQQQIQQQQQQPHHQQPQLTPSQQHQLQQQMNVQQSIQYQQQMQQYQQLQQLQYQQFAHHHMQQMAAAQGSCGVPTVEQQIYLQQYQQQYIQQLHQQRLIQQQIQQQQQVAALQQHQQGALVPQSTESTTTTNYIDYGGFPTVGLFNDLGFSV